MQGQAAESCVVYLTDLAQHATLTDLLHRIKSKINQIKAVFKYIPEYHL